MHEGIMRECMLYVAQQAATRARLSHTARQVATDFEYGLTASEPPKAHVTWRWLNPASEKETHGILAFGPDEELAGYLKHATRRSPPPLIQDYLYRVQVLLDEVLDSHA